MSLRSDKKSSPPRIVAFFVVINRCNTRLYSGSYPQSLSPPPSFPFSSEFSEIFTPHSSYHFSFDIPPTSRPSLRACSLRRSPCLCLCLLSSVSVSCLFRANATSEKSTSSDHPIYIGGLLNAMHVKHNAYILYSR